jgi:hypothetical protein
MKIAVLSDTHGLLRAEVLERLSGCDCILHGGDINRPEILQRLEEIAPVYAVRGNNDKEWAEHLPQTLQFQLEGLQFFMVHNKKDAPKDLRGVDIVVFGHSHKYSAQTLGDQFWLNPGSCGRRRFDQEITFAMLTVHGREFQVEKVVIPQQP